MSSSSSMGREIRGPTTRMISEAMAASEMQLPMARDRPSRSFAPNRWEMMMPAPVEMPTNRASNRLRMGLELPTAARALSPTYLPTTMESTVL